MIYDHETIKSLTAELQHIFEKKFCLIWGAGGSQAPMNFGWGG